MLTPYENLEIQGKEITGHLIQDQRTCLIMEVFFEDENDSKGHIQILCISLQLSVQIRLDVVEMDVDPLSRRGSDIAGSCPLLFISCVRNGKCDVITTNKFNRH
jgi:hypothetical protein